MLFQIYGETAGFQLLGWLMVFVGLIVANMFWGFIASPINAGAIANLIFVVITNRQVR